MPNQHDREIAAMFDRVAPRYDFFNRVLSFGMDVGWRRRAVRLADLRAGEIALDVGAGTGDLAFALLARAPRARVVGVDLSERMLALSLARAASLPARRGYSAAIASAEALPFADASVDRIITGFTVRNVGDLTRAFREFHRVLRPRGRAVILELSKPPNAAFASLYRAYFEGVLPRLAALLGGDRDAYHYLPRSLRPFPKPELIAVMLIDAGFARVDIERLAFGIAAIHVAEA